MLVSHPKLKTGGILCTQIHQLDEEKRKSLLLNKYLFKIGGAVDTKADILCCPVSFVCYFTMT